MIPGAGEVHVWCASLDVPSETSARLYATLAGDERSRSARYRFEHDRRRFIVAHGALRDLLGCYLQTDPARIRYVYNPLGKPELASGFGGRLRFNLSHSAGLALVAIVADSDVGIDLEYVRPRSEYAEIARRFFSIAEVDQLNRLPDHRYAEGFIRCWTKKEAYLKARGDGLSMPLDAPSVPVITHAAQDPADLCVASDDAARAKRWSFYSLRPAEGYIAALAIEGTGWRLSQWQWGTRSAPWAGPTETGGPAAKGHASNEAR